MVFSSLTFLLRKLRSEVLKNLSETGKISARQRRVVVAHDKHGEARGAEALAGQRSLPPFEQVARRAYPKFFRLRSVRTGSEQGTRSGCSGSRCVGCG